MSNVEIELVSKKSEIDKKLSKVAARLANQEFKIRKEAEQQAVFSNVQEANTEEEDEVDMETFLKGSSKDSEESYAGRMKANMEEMQRLDDLLEASESITP